jgi:hypothetical protein
MLAPDWLMRPVPAVTVPPVGNAVDGNGLAGVTTVGNGGTGDPVLGNAAVGNSVRGATGGAANAGAQSAALNRNAGHAKFTLQALRRERAVCRSRGSFNKSNPVSSLHHVKFGSRRLPNRCS